MSGTSRISILPEHVGQRVTVRYGFPPAGGGTGQSVSEAVGVLREWPADASGDLVIENRHGDLVRVPVLSLLAARLVR